MVYMKKKSFKNKKVYTFTTKKKIRVGNSLVVQWLRLSASTE